MLHVYEAEEEEEACSRCLPTVRIRIQIPITNENEAGVSRTLPNLTVFFYFASST